MFPGLHLVERGILLSLARLLRVFNIELARDENENENIIPRDFSIERLHCPLRIM
jgi:hypothetical protein